MTQLPEPVSKTGAGGHTAGANVDGESSVLALSLAVVSVGVVDEAMVVVGAMVAVDVGVVVGAVVNVVLDVPMGVNDTLFSTVVPLLAKVVASTVVEATTDAMVDVASGPVVAAMLLPVELSVEETGSVTRHSTPSFTTLTSSTETSSGAASPSNGLFMTRKPSK